MRTVSDVGFVMRNMVRPSDRDEAESCCKDACAWVF